MTKRFSSKVLAVVLTLAICATTVLGCLMTVSAAESCYSFGAPKFPSRDDLSQVSLDVTFKAPASLSNGFAAGAFNIEEVDADAEDYLTIKEVNAVTEGVGADIEGDKVIFETDVTDMVTLELVFGFSNGVGTQGRDYYVTLKDVTLSLNDVEYYNETADGPVAKISTACQHVVTVIGDPIAIDEANNYSTYAKSVCTICGEEFGMQLVPTAEKLVDDGANGTATGKVVYWDNTKTAPTSTAAGTKDDPIIINTPAELAYIATATNSKATVNPDKYYKIADDVKAFVLQSETYGADIMALSGSDAVSAYFSDTSKSFYQWAGVSDYTNIFSGHFDGNGITVYGLYNTQANKRQGLFGEVDGNATICNVNVKGAYITTTSGWVDQGAIVGSNRNKYGVGPGTGGQDTLVIKKCSVIDCYMRSSDTVNDNRSANGVIAGRSNVGLIMIDNCFVMGNDTLFTNNTLSQEYALYGNALNAWNVDSSSAYFKGAYDNYYPNVVANAATGNCICNMVVNTVAIGTLPYHLGYYGNRLDNKECFINVYTDGPAGKVANSYIASGTTYNVNVEYAATQIANVAPENFKGAAAVIAMPNLDWDKTWLIGENDGYPYLAPQGYTSDTIYWNGTTSAITSTAAGTPEDPIIINTAEELAWLVKDATANGSKGASNVTTDKYYKVADGIKNIVLQPYAYAVQIKKLNGSAETKAYFDANSASMLKWVNEGWEQGSFAGIFDGNNATIYGMYQETTTNAGLFSTVDAGAVFKNFAVKNSYLIVNKAVDTGKTSGYTDYQLSVIAATSSSNSYGAQRAGIILVENCEVSGNYLRQNTSIESGWDSRTGVLVGNVQQDVLAVENCLVYDNNATYGREADESVKAPLIANAGNNDIVESSATIPAGYEKTTHTEYNNDGTVKSVKVCATVRDSIVLGCDVMNVALDRAWRRNGPGLSYKNVYTDGVSGTVTFPSGTQWTYAEDEIAAITYADALGTRAQSKLPNLAWGTDWYCGTSGNPPVLATFTTTGANSVSTGSLQLYGSSVTYNDDGTLDFNLHFVPEYSDIKATLYVGTLDGSKFFKLDGIESSYRDDLGANAMMFTIPNISAKDINKVWLPTVVVTGAAKAEWGLSQPIALADNASAVLEGNFSAADKAVSAALINYGVTSVQALNAEASSIPAKTKVVYWDNQKTAPTSTATGTADDPIIINTPAELAYVATAGITATLGKHYKIADGIKAFVLQPKEYGAEIMALDSSAAVETYFSTEGKAFYQWKGCATWQTAVDKDEFAGSFDGNGVEIYGLYNTEMGKYKGLFGKTDADNITISNLSIKNSYILGNDGYGSAFILGHSQDLHNTKQAEVVVIKNCAVMNSVLRHVSSASNEAAHRNYSGVIAGQLAGRVLMIENCLAVGNDTTFTYAKDDYTNTVATSLYGSTLNSWNITPTSSYYKGEYGDYYPLLVTDGSCVCSLIVNTISIGTMPYHGTHNYSNRIDTPACFINVYTDMPAGKVTFADGVSKTYTESQIKQITDLESMKGTAAQTTFEALDFDSKWMATVNYPQPVQSGYTPSGVGKTLYWSGNKDTNLTDEVHEGTTQDGTEANPIIIDSAEELAYIASAGPTVTQFYNPDGETYKEKFTGPKHYKIADGIDKIVVQNASYSEILNLSSLEETRKYFSGETGVTGFTTWAGVVGWQGADPATYAFDKRDSFCGIFDGNGVEVYGIYMCKGGYGGLFGDMDGNAAVKNVTVKNSYITIPADKANGDHRVAAIVAHCDRAIADTTGSTVETITIENCKVENCYMSSPDLTERSGGKINTGVLVANMTDSKLVIKNCIVINSEAYYDSDDTNVKSKLVGNVNSGSSNYRISNSIILGVDPGVNNFDASNECFTNVYTDQTTSNSTVTTVALSNLKGSAAANIVNAINEANGKTIWYVGAAGDVPGFKAAGTIPSAYQKALDNVKFDAFDTVGAGTEYYSSGSMKFGVYQTALSLKANPYMSFAFAFGDDYKTNRDKIKIRFTYTQDDALTTSEEIAVPAYTGADIKNVNGWTNTTANGRFHTYKAECIPVEALAYGIKVEASYNGGAWQDFGTYSVSGLGMQFDALKKTQPGAYYETRVDATKALLFYAQAIAARYGA